MYQFLLYHSTLKKKTHLSNQCGFTNGGWKN